MHIETDHPGEIPSADELDLALRSFWNGSPAEFDRLVRDGDNGEPGVCSLFADLFAHHPEGVGIPEAIPGYRIIREIGSGGMAVVYEALQERTGRRVALKVVQRWGANNKRRIRLFRREIDSLARLDHPHIATLFDAGQTPSGDHFFAMELVRGATLAEHMARESRRAGRSAWIRTQIELFVRICRALNYAHQRGVLHCDLKPANILIVEDLPDERSPDGPEDRTPADANRRASPPPLRTPKVLDFGLARLLDPEAAAAATMIDCGHLVGTLAYMSPEQTRQRSSAIDIRSDVYALGVILYEWLTGQAPYPIRGAAVPDAIRMICEMPPKKPHTVRRELAGDLETIMLKALDKDPERRYQSAFDLAADLERYLANQPISARPPSAAYQLRKMIARHKVPAAMGAALLLLALVFAVTFGIQAARIADERNRAQAGAARVEQINEFMDKMLTYVDPHAVGPRIHVRELLDQAAAAMPTELADQPEIRATLHQTLGRSYMALQAYDEAEHHIRAGLKLCTELFGRRDARTATALHNLGVLTKHQRKDEDGLRPLEEALALRREIHGERHAEVAESLHALAQWHQGKSNYQKADELFREALAMRRELPEAERGVGDTLHAMGLMLVAAARYEEAEPLLLEALELRLRLLGNDHFDVARTMTDLGEIYFHWSEYDRAEALYREEIRIWRSIFGEEGNNDLAVALSDLAGLLDARGNLSEAEAAYREAVAMERRVSGPHRDMLPLNNLAVFLTQQGRYDEAEPMCREVYGDWSRYPEPRGYAAQNLAEVLLELGEWDEAERLYRQAIDSWTTLFGRRHPKLAKALIGLGRLMELRGDRPAARALFEDAYDVLRNRLGDDSSLAVVSTIFVAGAFPNEDRIAAEALCREAVSKLKALLGDNHPDVAWAFVRLGRVQFDVAQTVAAEESFAQAIAIERSLPRSQHPNLAAALAGLGQVLLDRGERAAARPLLEEALATQAARYESGDPRTAKTRALLASCLQNAANLHSVKRPRVDSTSAPSDDGADRLGDEVAD